MQIEVLDFFPLENNQNTGYLSGTLRIRLPEQGIILMGIFVSLSRSKGRYFFNLPSRKGSHHETGEDVRYPCIVFENPEKQKELMDAIIEEGKIFIENLLTDPDRIKLPPQNPNSSLGPQKTLKHPNPLPTTEKAKEDHLKTADPKPTTSVPKPAKKTAFKEYVDLPKKKPASTKKVKDSHQLLPSSNRCKKIS